MNGNVRSALWWKWEKGNVRCLLCPHSCLLTPGDVGQCRSRRHERFQGLVSTNYGLVSAVAVDPVEKKPLYHWYPGTSILSLGSVGCSMNCPFCQNWPLAEWSESISLSPMEPEIPAELAKKEGVSSVAFTYNEPLIWYEFLLDASRALSDQAFSVVLVSNGMISSKPLQELVPLVSAANIDLKAFTEDTYRFLGGHLGTVKNTIKVLLAGGVHVEVTFLLVPGINDKKEPFLKMIRWLASLDPQPVLHISRYFPNKRWDRSPTPLFLLKRFSAMAREMLPYVYTGNTEEENTTLCHVCGKVLLKRREYTVLENNLDSWGRCLHCGGLSSVFVRNNRE